ncbi:hypothetical protein WA158_000652 [Blastocystis sp. Blastoise]
MEPVKKEELIECVHSDFNKYIKKLKSLEQMIDHSITFNIQNNDDIQNSIDTELDSIKLSIKQSLHDLQTSPSQFIIMKRIEYSDNSDGLFVFQENKNQWSIPKSTLLKFPSSLLCTLYLDKDAKNNDGTIYIDHSELYFQYIYETMLGKQIDISTLKEQQKYDLYNEYSFYAIDPPFVLEKHSLVDVIKNKMKKKSIDIFDMQKCYSISKVDIHKRNISIDQFCDTLSKRMKYDVDTDELLLSKNIHFFKYISNYISEGNIYIENQDRTLEKLKLIREEFHIFNILHNQQEMNKIVYYNYQFPRSKIMNDSFAYIVAEWLGFQKQWILLYRGSKDGFNASDFHRCCDNRGETIVFIRSKDNNSKCIFGGYTSVSWTNALNKPVQDPKAFLFTLKNPYRISPSKYKAYKSEFSHINRRLNGPVFGFKEDENNYDLCVNTNNIINEKKTGYSSFTGKRSFPNPTEYGMKLFTGTGNGKTQSLFTIDEIEVYGTNNVIIDIDKENNKEEEEEEEEEYIGEESNDENE